MGHAHLQNRHKDRFKMRLIIWIWLLPNQGVCSPCH